MESVRRGHTFIVFDDRLFFYSLQIYKMETILNPEESRTNLFPIRFPTVWERYKKAVSAFWVVGEVDLSKDVEHWERLTKDEKHFISMVLAFFANSDGIVNDNLAERFGREVTIREAKCFYDMQKLIENVHNEMYSLLIQTYIQDEEHRNKLFNATQNYECVAAKAQWAQRWIHDENASFAERLVAFAVVEGIFFSGSFCAIFWLKQRQIMPGLCASNTLIARDEGMHQEFATHMYSKLLQTKLTEECVHEIVKDAVKHEKTFICEALPVSLIGMNAHDMSQYIEFVADRLLLSLGHSQVYFSKCPFEFMTLQGIEGKTNFFEHRVTEYQKHGARRLSESHVFSTTADF